MLRSGCSSLFAKRGIKVFGISGFYWFFPIVLIITFSRFEYCDDITRRMTDAQLVEIESVTMEQGSATHSDGGLSIDGKTTSQIGHGIQGKLKQISAPSSLYETANKMDEETVVLFDRVLSQSKYSAKMIREE